MYLGGWKLKEIGVYPRTMWTAHNWSSLCKKILDFRILFRSSWFTKLRFGAVNSLSTAKEKRSQE